VLNINELSCGFPSIRQDNHRGWALAIHPMLAPRLHDRIPSLRCAVPSILQIGFLQSINRRIIMAMAMMRQLTQGFTSQEN
jgi:hypothetical protein